MKANTVWKQQERERRRNELRRILGDVCARCGSTEGLDFDHIDPRTKLFAIGDQIDKPWKLLLVEVAKCQLLCRPCHVEKSREDETSTAVEHGGGASGKRNCPCDLCKARKADYMRSYHGSSGAANSEKTHCKNGHEFTPQNTYLRPTGGRQCKRCRADRAAQARRA